MNYLTGMKVEIDDNIKYNKQSGKIICINESGRLIKTPNTAAESFTPNVIKGILIEFDNGALLHLDEADDWLLEFVGRNSGQH